MWVWPSQSLRLLASGYTGSCLFSHLHFVIIPLECESRHTVIPPLLGCVLQVCPCHLAGAHPLTSSLQKGLLTWEVVEHFVSPKPFLKALQLTVSPPVRFFQLEMAMSWR